MHAFPEAKVIHTERPEEDWWRSFSTTISKFFTNAPGMDLPPHIQHHLPSFNIDRRQYPRSSR